MKTNEFIEKVIGCLDRDKNRIDWSRFNSCNAYLGATQYIEFEGETHKITPIKSYYTIVGFYDESTDIAYEYGKYSSTTSKQFTQICNQRLNYPKRELVDVSTSGRW